MFDRLHVTKYEIRQVTAGSRYVLGKFRILRFGDIKWWRCGMKDPPILCPRVTWHLLSDVCLGTGRRLVNNSGGVNMGCATWHAVTGQLTVDGHSCKSLVNIGVWRKAVGVQVWISWCCKSVIVGDVFISWLGFMARAAVAANAVAAATAEM